MTKQKKCVECGDDVPAYQNYLCEKCWKEALNEKLNEEEKQVIAASKVDIENPSNKWFR